MKPVIALDIVLEAGNLLGGHKFLTYTPLPAVHPCLCSIYVVKIGFEKIIGCPCKQFWYKMRAPIHQTK